MAKIIREQLINQLAKGDFVSGQALGDMLGVSRAAVSKHIHILSDMGLDIFKVSGKGYKLATPLDLLDENVISKYLEETSKDISIEVHSLIDSTNSHLMAKLSSNIRQGHVCLAEYQSKGRGRRGRQWISPFGSHLYMSMYWQFEQGMSAVMGLSLVAGLAVSDTLSELFNIDVQLKWPNDIYINGEKLAGILVELEGQTYGLTHAVIGIGLNLSMPKSSEQLIDQRWTDISKNSNKEIDRNLLAATTIKNLTNRLHKHSELGLEPMLADWHKKDLFLNKQVVLQVGEKEVFGISRGVNHHGALLIEVDGKTTPVYGGEVSLRAAQ